MKPKRIVIIYLFAQAILTLAWWALLTVNPKAIVWFHPIDWPRESLLGFWLSDVVLLVAGSCITAVAIETELSWASHAIWALAAAIWYPTLYCLGASLMTDQAWLATAAMACLAGCCSAMATIYGTSRQKPAAIRALRMPPRAALAWTTIQVVAFWSIFLWVLPKGIAEVEQRSGLMPFQHTAQSELSLTLLAVASLLGICSAVAMSFAGEATPLPTATPSKLVTQGPYRWVRNPMAVAGIAQGVAVGWWLGSWSVIVYALVGACGWHWLVRPFEERDLTQCFGRHYTQYQETVGLWLPSRTTYAAHPPSSTTRLINQPHSITLQ